MPHKFRIMRPPLAVGLALILCNTVFAQKPDLVPLNAGFAGTVVFKLDKNDRLVMDHFDQGGRIRQDIVRIEDLDPQAVTFSAEEQAVALKCLPEKAQCISKEIFKLDVLRLTSRVTMPVAPDDPDGTHSIQLLHALISTTNGAGAQADAETPTRTTRKNPR